MTKNLCLALSLGKSHQKRALVKKLVSTLAAMLVISMAAFDTSSDLPYSNDDEQQPTPIRFGLSRQRGAFRKAVNMLAEAAPENERLADYYERVTSRVKGVADEAEQHSGTGVAVVVRKGNPARSRVQHQRAQTASQGLVAVAQAGTIPGTGSDSNSSATANSDSRETQAPEWLTVGDMDFEINSEIEQWINYFENTPAGRNTLRIGFERSSAYLEMARTEFRNAGVPEDLVWLACVESVWNPRAVSPAAAGGIWQFIPSTASEYGLKVESGNDERADPLKQTRVAAAYLRDLYTIFGDWSLAMAAYNSGEPRVMGAIVKNGNANFWELAEKGLLPKETCSYVPKILATIKLASRADEYGS